MKKLLVRYIFLAFVSLLLLGFAKPVSAQVTSCADQPAGTWCLYGGIYYGGPNRTDQATCRVVNNLWTCDGAGNCVVPGQVHDHAPDPTCHICPAYGDGYVETCVNNTWHMKYADGYCGFMEHDGNICPYGCGSSWNVCKPAPTTTPAPPGVTYTCVPAGGICNPSGMLNTSCGTSSWSPRGGTCATGTTCMWCPPPPVVTQPPTCPNNVCGAGETCNNCPQDCGICQPTATATPRPSPTPTNTPTPRPSPTPTPTPTATPTPTNTPTPTPTPTATPTPTPTPTPSPTPTPTPTPFPFDNSMCQCDGIKKPLDPIVIGNPFHVTAYGKVMGVNKNYAKIPTFTFSFYKGGGTVVTLVKPPEKVNTTVIEDTADKTKYQAIWTLDLSGIDKTQTYRIQAHPDCSRKAAVNYFTPSTVVLGASTKAPSLWDRILAFIFGSSSNQSNQVSIITPTPTLTAQQKKNLQLQTFTPAKAVETGQDANNCTFIKFSF